MGRRTPLAPTSLLLALSLPVALLPALVACTPRQPQPLAEASWPRRGQSRSEGGVAVTLTVLSEAEAKALLGYGVQQLALVLEVVVGRGRAHPGLAGHSAEGQGRGAFAFQQAAGGVHQGAAEVTVVVGTGFGGQSFSHSGHPKTICTRRKVHLDAVQIGAILTSFK